MHMKMEKRGERNDVRDKKYEKNKNIHKTAKRGKESEKESTERHLQRLGI